MEFQASLFGRTCANILPSPPASPSIYAYPSAFGERCWYTTRLASPHVLSTPTSTIFNPGGSAPHPGDGMITASRSEGNPPRERRSPPRSSTLHQISTAEDYKPVSSGDMAPGLPPPDQVPDHLGRENPLKQRPTRASSTASQPTPQFVLTEAENQSDGEELATGTDEEEDVAGGTEILKSGAERLAEKRKLKRFRLTHAQTRYLTSEFSRQPHPDAAQRERLSRDIPGLNPRQVQVWFQNRRAKLKRLTSDDQERMRSSRALPEDFDFSQTLQPILREVRPLYGSALTNPFMLGVGMSQKPSLRLGMSHLSTASNSVNSSFTNRLPSPISANQSPVSSANDDSERSGPFFSATQSPVATGPQFTNPFGHSHSPSSISPAFQRPGRSFSQSSIMGLGGQPVVTISPPNPSPANNTFDHGNLPPLQFSRTPFQTRDDQCFGGAQTTEKPSYASGMGMNQHYISPPSPPSTLSYDQSHMLYPSGSGFLTSSYYQSQNTTFWQGSQTSRQQYQYGQSSQPHQTTEQPLGMESSQNQSSQDPGVNRRDQRSYSHSGEHYRRASSPADPQFQPTFLRGETATGRDAQQTPDAARPRARSETFPAYYNAQQ